MKKIFLISLLSVISFSAFAEDTNYKSYDECYQAMSKFTAKAQAPAQAQLSYWFDSFGTDTEALYDLEHGSVTFRQGCSYLISADQGVAKKLWIKIQQKLNQQIEQLNAGQASLFGDRAELVCGYDNAKRIVDIDSCL